MAVIIRLGALDFVNPYALIIENREERRNAQIAFFC